MLLLDVSFACFLRGFPLVERGLGRVAYIVLIEGVTDMHEDTEKESVR